MFKVECVDSLKWLQSQPDQSVPNFVTGIPDLNELGDLSVEEYLNFFDSVSHLIFKKVRPDGYCIFIQTDRRIGGQWIDKSFFLTKMAYQHNAKLIWHKIVCQRDVGKTDLHRPTYSHMLCYTVKGSPGVAFPDVLPVGDKLYENATPMSASEASIQYIANQIKKQKRSPKDLKFDVIDPFVGRGTIGLSALQHGLSFLGLDLDPQQCQATHELLSNI
jgi:hypothetical protein